VATIDALFDELIKRGGSHLHLAVGDPPLARVRGELVALRDAPVSSGDLEAQIAELLTPAQQARLVADLELEVSHAHRETARFRASYFRKSSGLAVAFHLVPGRVVTLSELACPEVLWKLAERRAGLILVTGPTGAGKSTTAAALVDQINRTRACHILTVEDPLEFVHEPQRAEVTQREVGVHVSTFAAALRSAPRENADVVFLGVAGGMSAETLGLALELACSGVLVITTVPTNGAVATVESLVSAFPENERPRIGGLLGDALVGIVSQHLIRTGDGKGRVAVHEILTGSAAVATAIREGKLGQLTHLMQVGQAQGMQTMDFALERLLSQARIAPEAALARAVDKETFGQVVVRLRPDLADVLG